MAPKRINQCQQKAGLVVVTQLSADWSSTNQTRTQSGTDKFKLETSVEPLPATHQIQGYLLTKCSELPCSFRDYSE